MHRNMLGRKLYTFIRTSFLFFLCRQRTEADEYDCQWCYRRLNAPLTSVGAPDEAGNFITASHPAVAARSPARQRAMTLKWRSVKSTGTRALVVLPEGPVVH